MEPRGASDIDGIKPKGRNERERVSQFVQWRIEAENSERLRERVVKADIQKFAIAGTRGARSPADSQIPTRLYCSSILTSSHTAPICNG